MRILCFFLILAAFIVAGCSGSSHVNPVLPVPASEDPTDRAGQTSHTNWGLWQFVADPVAETLEFVQLRTGAMHLNALPFVNEPALVYLSLESLAFNGNIIDAGIGLRHPFLGLTEFTGFDVKGIFITNGSITGFTNSDLVMAGLGDTRLLNPDGYSRWWNPAEFPNTSTMFGYMDGVLGAPDSFADYNSTLNGYKYFSDELEDSNAPLSDVDPEGRGVFSAGMKNVRHYTLELGTEGLVFNYAVDASWQFPSGDPPWNAPDDFPEGANQPEAYRISVTETQNTLYYDEIEGAGGNLHLSIEVYDWFGADLHTVYAEWPGIAPQAASYGPIGGGVGYSTYTVEINDCTPLSAGTTDILITIESEAIGYQEVIPGEPVSAYFIHTAEVAGEAPASGYNIVFSDEGILPEIYATGWDDISPALCIETDDDIKMAYNHNKVTTNDQARSYACKSSDGLNWTDFQVSFQSWGGTLANHGDNTKIVADNTGNSWRYLSLYHVVNGYWSTPFAAATEMFPPPYYIDGAHVTTYISRAAEMIQDADGYVYVMGDRSNQLQFKKSQIPNHLIGGPSGAVWSSFPIHYIGTGYFSRARSIELAPNDTMYFVYYQNDTSNQIKLAYNTDSSGLTWDNSTIVYDGSTTGTIGAHDPGLDIDPDGEFHVTFVRVDSSTGNNQICYVYSADGSSWSDAVVIAEMTGAMNDDPVCFFEFDGYDFVAAVWQAGTHIFVSFSYDGGQNWADAAQVDSLLDENVQPDFVVTSDGVMHIAWAAMNGTHYDIHYRNAWLEES